VVVIKRGGSTASFRDVAIDEPGGDVELRGQRLPSAHTHNSFPPRTARWHPPCCLPRRGGAVMKALFAALLGVALLAPPVADVLAQSASSSPTPVPPPQVQSGSGASGSASGTLNTPGGSASGSVSSDRSGSSTSTTTKSDDRRDDGGSALPRSAVSERTTM